ncbi:hypothetical protein ACU4GD_25110 [Cupriavidus basilensis]
MASHRGGSVDTSAAWQYLEPHARHVGSPQAARVVHRRAGVEELDTHAGGARWFSRWWVADVHFRMCCWIDGRAVDPGGARRGCSEKSLVFVFPAVRS